MLEKHGVMIRCMMTKYEHTHIAFVEALNKLLAEQLFKVLLFLTYLMTPPLLLCQ